MAPHPRLLSRLAHGPSVIARMLAKVSQGVTPSVMFSVALAAAFGFAGGAAHAAMLDPTNALPGTDAPPEGRALFDYLTANPDGSGYTIPYPVESLIAAITAKTGVTPKVVLVPKTRSLDRDHADYSSPRMIYAFDMPSNQSASDLGYNLKDKLYIGGADRGQQLEVISYNGAVGRYEFQLVKNYAAGTTPNLVYADRTLCTKCHHDGSTLWSQNPWPETNGSTQSSHNVADLIKDAMGGATTFHSAQVYAPLQSSYDIDNSTVRANYINSYQRLWMDGCGLDAPTAAQCRATILKSALQLAFTSPPVFDQTTPEYKTLVSTWQTQFSTTLGGGVQVPNPKLLVYDPLASTGVESGFTDLGPGITPAAAVKLQTMLKNSDVPHAVDPLFQYVATLENWTLNSVCFGKCVIYGVARMLSDADKAALVAAAGNSFPKVSAAIDALLAANSPILADRAFRRGVVVKTMLTQLAAAVPVGGADEDYPTLPAAAYDVAQTVSAPDGTPLGLMKSYCQPCHSEFSGARGFLNAATDAARTALIKAEAPEIVVRLTWENPPQTGHAFMPPANSADPTSPRTRLIAAPADRQAILKWVQSL